MKTNFVIFAVVMIAMTACRSKTPLNQQEINAKKQIVGVWNEIDKTDQSTIKSLVFTENGSLTFRWQADESGEIVIAWGGDYANLKYTVTDTKLSISSCPDQEGKVSMAYASPYSLTEDILTIDSFTYSKNSLIKNFKLQKAEQIPVVALSEQEKKQMDAIFSCSNERLNENNVVVIRTMEELKAICPDNITPPEIEFSEQCIVFASLPNITNEVIKNGLFRNNSNDLFEFVVIADKSIGEETIYTYGVYAIPPSRITKIKAMVQLVFE